MPDEDLTFTDLVRGEVTFKAGSVPDFVIVRANGQPLYTLVNPVDDALMGITHVLRGEDLLSSTPRQIALYRALPAIGVGSGEPVFGHLPSVLGEGNKKLSKRDPESNLFLHRDHGFTPEGLLNYLALLGWSIGPDRDIFSMAEMTAAFDVGGRQPEPGALRREEGRGDQLGARPAAGARGLPRPAGPVPAPRRAWSRPTRTRTSSPEHRALLDAGAPLIQERITLLGEAVGMLGFLFVADDALEIADDARGALREESAVGPRRRRRRAGGPRRTSPRPRRRRRCRPRSSTGSASSRGSRSRRCASR